MVRRTKKTTVTEQEIIEVSGEELVRLFVASKLVTKEEVEDICVQIPGSEDTVSLIGEVDLTIIMKGTVKVTEGGDDEDDA